MGILLRLVQAGGVEHDLRPQVWPLLLGCISADDDLATQNSKWRSAEVEFARLCALARDAGAARQHFRNRVSVCGHMRCALGCPVWQPCHVLLLNQRQWL